MKAGVSLTTRIALIALGAGLSFLVPFFRSAAGLDRGTTWTGIIFIAIAIVLFVGARLYARKKNAPEEGRKP